MRWAFEVMDPGLADELVLLIGIPALALTLVLLVLALVELALLLVTLPVVLLLRAMRVIGWGVVVVHTAPPVAVEKETGSVRLRRSRFSTTVLQVGTLAGSARLRGAIAEHLRQGGDVTDPVVDQWLADEHGTVVSREPTLAPEPDKPTTKPA
ncbi:hypothetical protein [Actinophytocola xanthii]|uniref:hypothetical protein n=1 Tax=Actinophytocola xanthii TaxID=1912961 RepID=UPI0011782192|nr:hypothetical protein [Actinophytocola xanthii]